MKFLHAADIHLDSPMLGLARYEGAPVERIQRATRLALENMVKLAIEEQVDFVLIAGDLYDGDWKDVNTGLFFTRQMHRLREADIPIYLIRGNHDAASRITKELSLPDNVIQFSHRKPESKIDDLMGIMVHGQSYPKPAVTENLAQDFSQPFSGYFNIGLLHTNVAGNAVHENYAPCSLDDLTGKGYDYWALGHIHRRMTLHEKPWVVYPGNTQGRHVNESGEKGCVIVDVEDNEVQAVEFHPLDTVRWTLCKVGIHTDSNPHDAVELAVQQITRKMNTLTGQLLAVRIVFDGESRAHDALSADPERWRVALINELLALGDNVWLESMRIESRSTLDLNRLENRDDALGELLQLIREVTPHSELVEEFKQEVMQPLIEKIPCHELQELYPGLKDNSLIASRLEDVKHLIYHRILEGEREQ